jgi:hypothetical protein
MRSGPLSAEAIVAGRAWRGCAAAAIALSLAGQPARAQTADALPPLELGHIPTYPTAAAARLACGRDVVVWADPDSGYYYPHWHRKYGATPHGAYTCLRAAIRADYWNTNPFAGGPATGRSFPIDPALLGPGV